MSPPINHSARKHAALHPPSPHPPLAASVIAQITALPTQTISELRALWRSHFPKANANHHRAFLEKRLAHRLQEMEFRKHPEGRNMLDRNQRKIDALIELGRTRRRGAKIALTPGTQLTREFHDVEHHVLVSMDGSFEYQGQRYSSLSKIASEITGCVISGPMFFGLKPPRQKRKSGKLASKVRA
jgi:hypothetical protein